MSVAKFRCPACGFQIFNRRVANCESCGVALPSELLFTKEQIAALNAEHEKSRKEREARAEATRRTRGDSGGGEYDSCCEGGGADRGD